VSERHARSEPGGGAGQGGRTFLRPSSRICAFHFFICLSHVTPL